MFFFLYGFGRVVKLRMRVEFGESLFADAFLGELRIGLHGALK